MGLDTLPKRKGGQTISDVWYDVLRSVLAEDFAPRNSLGITQDQLSSLGTSELRWLYAHFVGLSINTAAHNIRIVAPTGLADDYFLELPVNLVADSGSATGMLFISSAGAATLITPDDVTLEVNGGVFQIKDGSVTRAKIVAALGQQISASSGSFSTANTGFDPVANLSVGLTTTGRPVMITINWDGSTTSGSILGIAGTRPAFGLVRIKRDSTEIARFGKTGNGLFLPGSMLLHIDTPSAGTYTYSVEIAASSAPAGALYIGSKLVAFEFY